MTRVAYLGPPGTFTEQALRASAARVGLGAAERVPLATNREVVLALARGEVEHAIVPLENSLEGSVNEAIDALIHDAPQARITGETVLPVHHALVGRAGADPALARAVVSHPQALAQCAGFLRSELPRARAVPATSTAEAVRLALTADEPTCAIATPLAAELYGAAVLRENVEDDRSNMTRFVWLAGRDAAGDRTAGADMRTPADEPAGDDAPAAAGAGSWKTSLVFSGDGDGAPGWLLDCLAEFAQRDVNLTRIESRPAKARLGHYLFLVDASGRADVPGPAADAVTALAGHCEQVRVLGCYRTAPAPGT